MTSNGSIQQSHGRSSTGRAWLQAIMLRDPGRWSSRLGALLLWMKLIGRGQRRRFGRAAAGLLAGASGIALMALLAGPMAPPAAAAGATINVDATCSLVDAIKSANTNTAVGTCEAGTGDDTIILSGDVALTASVGYYNESNTGLPLITSTVTIESAAGEHYTITRDSAEKFRLFSINASGDLTLRNLTLSNGNAYNVVSYRGDGGAIYIIDGRLTLDRVILSGNQSNSDGGAIVIYQENMYDDIPPVEVTISNSVFTNNVALGADGGAISIERGGLFTLTNSLIISNSADSGGGIYFSNSSLIALVENTTIANNYGESGGGGVYVNNGKQITIRNTTISGNNGGGSDGGGAKLRNAPILLDHVTITDNETRDEGGGVYSSSNANVTIRRSIISGNRESGNADNEIDEDGGSIKVYDSVLGHGGQTYDAAFSSITLGASNTIATSDRADITLEAILETALADNGGPDLPGGYAMLTHNLVVDSPAIDKTDKPCSLSTDQRGVFRPLGSGCDAGAVEFKRPPLALVSTWAAGTVDGLAYGPHDILMWDVTNDTWTKWFTGTEAGLNPTTKFKHNINAISIADINTGQFAVSFIQNQQRIGTLGWVDGYDILWWDGAKFTRWFEGEKVGLNSKTQEKIDGLHVLEEAPAWSSFAGQSCDAYLLISTIGPGLVRTANPAPANILKFRGEDILGFCATNLGLFTSGAWEMVLDGSEMLPKPPTNSVDSISVSDDGTQIFGTVRRQLPLNSQVYVYDIAAKTVSGPVLSFAAGGLTSSSDALQIVGALEVDGR